ncbi:phosphoribosyltransferase-like predicted ribonucleoside biosynthesis protein [Kineococcus rhizosphaerae]|uniref:Phosphoribosyltransferase-like predicted ribonucleoside biosynthesis protein n=1 Tax=Kineococcus rhizosphaerae TaxID=559628 RepID=A0A2T0R8C0_9ACTN|nr:phosphoribosyltransferase family protein [Kineococcus rhizosphaerae]PRY17406.1 phosphoribosyltransferase-like predicted ribonucleoside biosynthesis protein [Kineococcus rhizosphaerae]
MRPTTTGTTRQWVADRLGVRVEGDPGVDGLTVGDLVGLALRRNPRRAHLLVSRVLGKHVPTDPRLVRAAGLRLGARVAAVLGVPDTPGADPATWRAALDSEPVAAAAVLAGARRAPARPDAVVLGYAETATGLGQTVADALGCAGLHSTRRDVPGAPDWAGFEEEHSHATGHRLLPTDPAVRAALADPAAPLVLVDDELSTGRTVVNTLRAVHALAPHRHYVVAGLVDLRSPADRARLDDLAAELSTRIDVVALADGRVELPEDVLVRAAELTASVEPVVPAPATARATAGEVEPVRVDWPAGLPTTARFGTAPGHGERVASADLVRHLLPGLTPGGDVLVLGSEELLHAPLAVATQLAERFAGTVRFSSTTRSPVLAVDDPGYAVRSSVAFGSHDPAQDGPGVRYAHNVSRPTPWDAVVLVVDSASDPAALRAPDGVLAALAPHTARLLLLTLPADSWRKPA